MAWLDKDLTDTWLCHSQSQTKSSPPPVAPSPDDCFKIIKTQTQSINPTLRIAQLEHSGFSKMLLESGRFAIDESNKMAMKEIMMELLAPIHDDFRQWRQASEVQLAQNDQMLKEILQKVTNLSSSIETRLQEMRDEVEALRAEMGAIKSTHQELARVSFGKLREQIDQAQSATMAMAKEAQETLLELRSNTLTVCENSSEPTESQHTEKADNNEEEHAVDDDDNEDTYGLRFAAEQIDKARAKKRRKGIPNIIPMF